MKCKIHVNTHNIKHNAKHINKKKVLVLKTYKDNTYYDNITLYTNDGVEVLKIKYSPDKPLSCGAKVWIEFTDDIISYEGV